MQPEVDVIQALLRDSRTIAVVGLSSEPERPSHVVARYLQAHGYRIVPVNPKYAGSHILGEHCYPTLTLANAALVDEGTPIDMVDCFRRPAHIAPIVEEAIAIGVHGIWMQLGVVDQQAADAARRAGIAVVMDRCMKIEHARRP